ncbi:hypothetical protein B0H14DRAFT_2583319 [Mycena olivaceomarginata]|nr:hypothetical protein B0H14DRAFT_2583319 [Mycena olivaceomarginata]
MYAYKTPVEIQARERGEGQLDSPPCQDAPGGNSGIPFGHLERIAQKRSNYLTTAAAKIADIILAAELSGMFEVSDGTMMADEQTSDSHIMVEETHPVADHVWIFYDPTWLDGPIIIQG